MWKNWEIAHEFKRYQTKSGGFESDFLKNFLIATTTCLRSLKFNPMNQKQKIQNPAVTATIDNKSIQVSHERKCTKIHAHSPGKNKQPKGPKMDR